MRLPRLTGRAECKPFLDGSLSDPLLKTADPGNLPLQLISKKNEPVKHQVLNSTKISKSNRKLLGYPLFLSALLLWRKSRDNVISSNGCSAI